VYTCRQLYSTAKRTIPDRNCSELRLLVDTDIVFDKVCDTVLAHTVVCDHGAQRRITEDNTYRKLCQIRYVLSSVILLCAPWSHTTVWAKTVARLTLGVLPSPSFLLSSPFSSLPSSDPIRVLGERCELPSGVRGRAPAANAFWGYFKARKRFRWQCFLFL